MKRTIVAIIQARIARFAPSFLITNLAREAAAPEFFINSPNRAPSRNSAKSRNMPPTSGR